MNTRKASFQSLASCGAFHISFVGLAHEFIGAQLFIWAPEVFGPFLWHVAGLSIVAVGLLLLAGTLRLIRFPVVPIALLAAGVGAVTVVLIELLHGQFHFLAVTLAVAGVMTAVFHGNAERTEA